MKRQDWKYRRIIEKALEREIQGNLGAFTDKIIKNTNSIDEIIEALEELTHTQAWQKVAYNQGTQMVKRLMVHNARTWREAANNSHKGYLIYQQLKLELDNNDEFQRLIERNAGYIRTLPSDVATSLTQHISTQAIRGLRPESQLESIREYAPYLATWQSRRLARTETAKTWSDITQVRQRRLGSNWATWSGSLDRRERSAHRFMEGVLFNWNDLPSPEALAPRSKDNPKTEAFHHYGPAGTYNCRCSPIPMFDPDVEDWPKKAYINGRIIHMTKHQFERFVQ
jgi:hypothetical protein